MGTSQRPSSDIYTGPRPFSEKVTYNVAKYLYKRRSEVKGYIDFHAYSQMWLSPWGYTTSYPPHYSQHVSIHKSMTHPLMLLETRFLPQFLSKNHYQCIKLIVILLLPTLLLLYSIYCIIIIV